MEELDFKGILYELDKKNKILNVVTSKTDYAFGNTFFDITEKHVVAGKIIKCIKSAKKAGFDCFANKFETLCTTPERCSQNIDYVFGDSIDAFYMEFAELLQDSLDVSSEKMESLKELYLCDTTYYGIKKVLDDKYMSTVQEYSDEIEKISANYDYAASREFIGGGFGLKGAFKGIITARILNDLNSTINDAVAKNRLGRIKKKLDEEANHIYISDLAQSILKTNLEKRMVFVGTYALDIIAGLQGEFQYDFNLFENQLKDKFVNNSEQATCIAIKLLEIYPFCDETYKFINKNFINADKYLEKFMKKLSIDFNASSPVLLAENIHNKVYSNMKMQTADKKIKFADLLYQGNSYSLEIPDIDISFTEKVKIDLNYNNSNALYIEDDSNKLAIKIWYRGVINSERKDYLKPEFYMSFVDNAVITDNILDGNDCIEVLGTCKLENKYDGHLLYWSDNKIYFGVCVASLNNDEKKLVHTSEVVKKITITNNGCNIDKNHRSILSRIVEEVKTDDVVNNYEIDEYFEKSIIFRKRFKALVKLSKYSNYIVNKYVFDDEDLSGGYIKDDEYVLYKSECLVITDKSILILNDSEPGEASYTRTLYYNSIFDILELYLAGPVTSYSGYYKYIIFEKGDDNKKPEIIKVHDEDNIPEITNLISIINIAISLFSRKEKTKKFNIVQRSKESYCYCTHCNKISKIRNDNSFFGKSICGSCATTETRWFSRLESDDNYVKLNEKIENEIKKCESMQVYKDENKLVEKHYDKDIKGYLTEDDYKSSKEDAIEGLINFSLISPTNIAVNRWLLKFVFSEFNYTSNLKMQYDYQLEDKALLEIFEQIEEKGQFIIYHRNKVVITDQNIYLLINDTINKIELYKLIEFLPIDKLEDSVTDLIARVYAGQITGGNNPLLIKEMVLINIFLELREKLLFDKQFVRFSLVKQQDINARIMYCKWRLRGFDDNELLDGCHNKSYHSHYAIKYCNEIDLNLDGIYEKIPSISDIWAEVLKEDKDGVLDKFNEFVNNNNEKKDEYSKRINDLLNESQSQQKECHNTEDNNSGNEERQEVKTEKYCIYCGKKIRRTDKFCCYCGKEQ